MNARFGLTLRRISRAALFLMVLALTCGLAPQLGEDEPKVKVGEKAPQFTLTDAKGQERSLGSFAKKIVVLEWTNPDCPVVQGLYHRKVMEKTHKKLKTLDKSIVWLAVNSSAGSDERNHTFWINQHKIAYPILLDGNGKVGKSYGALRTPHMFVIDRDGKIRYHGAIDDNRLGSKPERDVRNYVVDAVKHILDDDAVSPDFVKPYGCKVKYRP